MFQHTAARRRLELELIDDFGMVLVSTHSRPKAAGLRFQSFRTNWSGFNTQPPEGGWMLQTVKDSFNGGFNTQPPEGGWPTSRKRDS